MLQDQIRFTSRIVAVAPSEFGLAAVEVDTHMILNPIHALDDKAVRSLEDQAAPAVLAWTEVKLIGKLFGKQRTFVIS